MKFSIIVLLILVGLTFAATTCQYGSTENKTEVVYVNYYQGTEKIPDQPVVIENAKQNTITRVGLNNNWVWQDSFDVVNKINHPISVVVSYYFAGNLASTTLNLAPLGKQTITSDKYNNNLDMPMQIDPSRISISYSGNLITQVPEDRTLEVRICKECPEGSGQACLNDGDSANADYLCGSGKRDSKGICMSLEDQKALIPKDFGKSISDFFYGAVFLIILIIFLVVILRAPPDSSQPDRIVHIWDR